MSLIIEAEYLYNDSGNHDKVYNVAIKEDITSNTDRYVVVAEWGPRLGVLKQTVKYSGSSLFSARTEFHKLIVAKRNSSGYRVVGGSASPRTALTNVPISTVAYKPSKPATKEPEPEPAKFDPNYVPYRRLDADL